MTHSREQRWPTRRGEGDERRRPPRPPVAMPTNLRVVEGGSGGENRPGSVAEREDRAVNVDALRMLGYLADGEADPDLEAVVAAQLRRRKAIRHRIFRLGLTQKEAAEELTLSLGKVQAWCSRGPSAAEGVLPELSLEALERRAQSLSM